MADRIHPASSSPTAPILQESKQLNGAYVQKPPEYPPPPASYRPPKRRRSCGLCCCLSWILSLIVLIIIILGIIVLVFWLVLRPIRTPDYNVEDVSVQRLNLLNSDPPLLNSTITYKVRTENRNKKIGIYYDEIKIYMNYHGLEVGQSFLPPFYQGHRNVTYLSGNLTTESLPISQDLASSLNDDIQAGSVPFQIRVRVKARIKIGKLKSPKIKVRDNCNIHVSPPTAPGGAKLLDKSCKLKVRL